MNKPKTTSRIWKDSRHIRGTEFSQEIKNVKAFNSYHRNPKQAFRSRKNNGKCNVLTSEQIRIEEIKLGVRCDGQYYANNDHIIAWVTDSTVIVPKPKAEVMPNKSHFQPWKDNNYWINRIANAV